MKAAARGNVDVTRVLLHHHAKTDLVDRVSDVAPCFCCLVLLRFDSASRHLHHDIPIDLAFFVVWCSWDEVR